MVYRIEHETKSRIRICVYRKALSLLDEEKIHFVLDQIAGVDDIEVYNATASVAIHFHADRDVILEALKTMQLENVSIPKGYIDQHDYVRLEELKKRHLGPKVKMRMRGKIFAEMIFDIVAPLPVAVGYHIYQLVTLKDI